MTVSEKPTTGLGDDAYTITVNSSQWEHGTTLIAARVGTAVITVQSTGTSHSAVALMKTIIAALEGKA